MIDDWFLKKLFKKYEVQQKQNYKTEKSSNHNQSQIWKKKIIFGPYFFFLLYNPFSFCNLNFELKVYFFNISVLEFERKSSGESYLKSVKKSKSNVSP